MLLEGSAGPDARRSTSSRIRAAGSSCATWSSAPTRSGRSPSASSSGTRCSSPRRTKARRSATPQRWSDTVGWMANLLELFPDNPFTTGAEFVANGLVWLARHASGDIPGSARDGRRRATRSPELQSPPGPPADAYSALVANYNPSATVLLRMLDTGVDQFFGSANDLVVPSEGGWRIDQPGAAHHSRGAHRLLRTRRQSGRRCGHARQLLLARRDRGLPRARPVGRGAAAPARSTRRSCCPIIGCCANGRRCLLRPSAAAPAARRRHGAAACARRGATTGGRAGRRRRARSLRDHGRQRRSHLRAGAAPARALPRDAADRHRARDEHADRRRDGAVARDGALSARARHAPDLREHAGRIRRARGACRARRR